MIAADMQMAAPFPLLEVAVTPRTAGEHARLAAALLRVKADDPAFDFATDRESGQILLKGVSEEQLAAKLALLRDGHDIVLAPGPPQVIYRETLARPASLTYVHKQAQGGAGAFAMVTVRFEPQASGFAFDDATTGQPIPRAFVAAVRRGIERQSGTGPLAGYPLEGFKAILLDGRYHEVDSNEATFEIAGAGAVRRLAEEGCLVLLEPVMRLDVRTPQDFLGGVIGDIHSRRGTIRETASAASDEIVVAEVPLSCLFGYAQTLAAIAQGRASHAATFLRHDRVPFVDDPDPRFPGAAAMRVA